MRNRKQWILVGGLTFASAALGQISTEQASETLKARQQVHKIAATQPASHEELDEAWTEIRNLRGDVSALREELNALKQWAAARDAVDNPNGNRARNGAARAPRPRVTPPAGNGSD